MRKVKEKNGTRLIQGFQERAVIKRSNIMEAISIILGLSLTKRQ